MVMLLWTSNFAMAKIECSFEIGKETPLGVPFILLLTVPVTFMFFSLLNLKKITLVHINTETNLLIVNSLKMAKFRSNVMYPLWGTFF